MRQIFPRGYDNRMEVGKNCSKSFSNDQSASPPFPILPSGGFQGRPMNLCPSCSLSFLAVPPKGCFQSLLPTFLLGTIKLIPLYLSHQQKPELFRSSHITDSHIHQTVYNQLIQGLILSFHHALWTPVPIIRKTYQLLLWFSFFFFFFFFTSNEKQMFTECTTEDTLISPVTHPQLDLQMSPHFSLPPP